MLKLHAEEEAVENVSGILRLYDLRMKTQNRIVTSRIMPMADVMRKSSQRHASPLTEGEQGAEGKSRKYTLPPRPA